MKELNGSSAIILGYGQEGESAHRYILKHYPDKEIGIADQKNVKPINPNVVLHTGENYLKKLGDYDVIIRSPGVPYNLPEIKESIKLGKKITSPTNIFFSECLGSIIGITGTKGKSTTASLLSEILKRRYSDVQLVGNIGKPALDFMDDANKDTLFVAELSSYQLEDSKYSPHIAVILNVIPEHIEHHGSLQKYIDAKKNISLHQTTKDIVVFNPSHKIPSQLASKSPGHKLTFSMKKTDHVFSYIHQDNIFVKQNRKQHEIIMPVKDIPLLGLGNVENTLAAISVGILLKVPSNDIKKAVMEFKSLPHRLEFVCERKGIKFYNDSLATIPEAVVNALEALGENVETLIAGGYDRGIDFSDLGKYLGKKKGLKTIILFPTTGKKIWKSLSNQISHKELLPDKYEALSMEDAVQKAFSCTSSGKICLLSPGSPSFGLFRNYEERGVLFKKLALEM
ncbi:UDP-N-acetylmuramoylalanine--D-glutamate ligase [Candidatus Curtissbacteria bacterium RIFCSPHIGHO2_12_FULL_38_9b]|uniref:UDP-N-acetylmuramoylalanine--D-glutamate ligase n=1 Tax=Candidatus Curtissbacteria bacterium RIFCSPHIGHO2_12_FULL_38_9b TaxID=1797720 RepID=A0A1F5GVA4_9BACT|nr:MAG: UDP-N-acetylmuramoylalanine--D-glutamate ligase [Candidatus Curtissbacteria bacterium RIFCSPHIGHO2_12_FULL_38_9b]